MHRTLDAALVRNSGPSAEGEEALAGLEQYHTGPPNDIYVIQGHQLRDWLAAHTAAAKREGAAAVVAAVEGLFACRCRDEAERECRDHGDGAAAFFTKAYEDAARAAASALDDGGAK